jgi:hypothetical protein
MYFLKELKIGLSKPNTYQGVSRTTVPRRTSNPPVAGSNPAGRAARINRFAG